MKRTLATYLIRTLVGVALLACTAFAAQAKGVVCTNWTEIAEALETGKSVTLATNVTMEASEPVRLEGRTVALDLAGWTLRRGDAAADDTMFELRTDAKLTLFDSVGGGCIAGSDVTLNATGGVFVVYSAQLFLYDVMITHFTASGDGGVLHVGDGAVALVDGCTFADCSSARAGGVAYVDDGATLMFSDCVFRGNAADGGGDVIAVDGAKAQIMSGLFTASAGDGEFLARNTGEIVLSGGVFERTSNFSEITYAAGCRRVLVGDYIAVGTGALTDGTFLRSGVFTFDPTNAPYAACHLVDTTVSTVTENGGSYTVSTPDDPGRASCWTWDETVAALTDGADVFLVTNVTTSAARLQLGRGQNVALDLNGHWLARAASDSGGSPFNVSNGVLTVVDRTGVGLVTGSETGGNFTSPLLAVGADGTLNVTGICFACFSASVPGPVISAIGGEIVLDACTVTNCHAVNKSGGALCVEGARLRVTACDFLDCSAGLYGGAVFAYGCSSLEFAFGVCRGNRASSAGDVLFVGNGEATIERGLFAGVDGTKNAAVATLSGGQVKIRGGVFDRLKLGTYISPDDGFAAATGGVWTVIGQDVLASGGSVRAGLFTFDPKAEPYSSTGAFHRDSTSVAEGTMWRLSDGYVTCSDWESVKTALASGRDVALATDVSASDSGVSLSGGSCTLDLAGHVLSHSGSASAATLFSLSGSAALTVETSTAGGAIAGSGTAIAGKGAFVLTGNASLKLAGAAIRDFCWNGRNGGAINATDSAKVTMTGGTITRCRVLGTYDKGGAICLAGDATFVMTGGAIADCSAADCGGGIYIKNNTTISLSGGVISGCSASCGGALSVCGSASVEIADMSFLQNCASDKGGVAYVDHQHAEFDFASGLCLGNSASCAEYANFYWSPSAPGFYFFFQGGVFDALSCNNYSCKSGFSPCPVGAYTVIGSDVQTNGARLVGGSYSFNPQDARYAVCDFINTADTCVDFDEASSLWKVYRLDDKPAQQITIDTLPGTELTEGIYEVTNNVTLTGGTGVSGLSIAHGATVAIYVKKGVTLKLTGGDGEDATAGGAGFEIPEDSTLIFVGRGKVIAQGGCSGTAGNGGNGGNASLDDSAWNWRSVSGAGGAGGWGAGGAGAGLGGHGGAGGAAGTGGASCDSRDQRGEFSASGNPGANGGSGGDGGSMGELNVLGHVSVTAYPGANRSDAGLAGTPGTKIDSHFMFVGTSYAHVGVGGGGGGGGGGMMTNEAVSVGHGGAGGGGGGGGGGNIDYNRYGGDCDGSTGEGGYGGDSEGERAEPTERASSKGRYDTIGGAGGASGPSGNQASDGSLYLSENASVSDGIVTGSRENHPFLRRALKLDLAGGNVKGDTSVISRDAYLYLDLPEVPLPDKAGCLFQGYYSLPEGGKMYYDETGLAAVEFWDRDFETSTLYARWREITPPANALVVTTLSDGPFDPDASQITLRAAVSWAMYFQNLTGADGTPSKITFDESLWMRQKEVTIKLTDGPIHVNASRFMLHPLIIEGPLMCDVVVNGSSFGRILDFGSENGVRISGLTFKSGYADGSGGAIEAKGPELDLTDCVFKSNRAEANGGGLSCSGRVSVVRCRFESNTASEKDGGGIYAQAGSAVTVTSCSFKENSARYGGGIAGGADFDVLNSTFILNKATSGGGYCLFEGSGLTGQNLFANCTFRSNTAKLGGGLELADAGRVTLINVLAFQNTGSDSSTTADIDYGSSASVTAKGVVAGKTNLKGGEDCTFDASLKVADVFRRSSPAQTQLPIGPTLQWAEPLKASDKNVARVGYDGSPYRTDMTGRQFDACQTGSYWSLVDIPSLVVDILDDSIDREDGFLSLREIVARLRDGEEDYLALEKDGVFPITFTNTLSGPLAMTLPQLDIKNLEGRTVEIDGGGCIMIRGFTESLDAKGKVKTNQNYRAFTVWSGNALRLKNLTFFRNVGSSFSSIATETRDGGAVSNRGRLEAESCTFTECSAGSTFENPTGNGGAIANGEGVTGATAVLSNCTFTSCRASQGGAIHNYAGNTLTLTDCAFTSNRAGGGTAILNAEGGAIYSAKDATLTYTGTTFTDNTAKLDGVDVPSDINTNVIASSYVTVSVAKGKMKVALNARATPTLASDAGGATPAAEEARVDFSDETRVSVKPADVKPFLYYGLGRADTPSGTYEVGEWVRADADGRLPKALAAPKQGDRGYYRVEVSLESR